MSGTKETGRKAAITNKEKYGQDFYRRIGGIGGKKGTADGTIKGFAAMSREQVALLGKKGGAKSKRGPKKA